MTKQEKQWAGKFGDKYTLRNFNAKSKIKLNLNRSLRILEVGANIGTQLLALKRMGFKNLYGIEINPKSVERARIKNIIVGSAFDIPFKDNYFDLVFTAGVLIHISPRDIKKVMKEIIRCSKKYVMGYEYYAPKYEKVVYRGNKDLLWKTDFAKLYQEFNLKLLDEKRFKTKEGTDTVFMLKKGRQTGPRVFL